MGNTNLASPIFSKIPSFQIAQNSKLQISNLFAKTQNSDKTVLCVFFGIRILFFVYSWETPSFLFRYTENGCVLLFGNIIWHTHQKPKRKTWGIIRKLCKHSSSRRPEEAPRGDFVALWLCFKMP